jgi:hypothetical protein
LTTSARDVGFADIHRGRMCSAAQSRICATASSSRGNDPRALEEARQGAIEWYERLLREYPSEEAKRFRWNLAHLKLGADTAQRRYFCEYACRVVSPDWLRKARQGRAESH